MRARLPEMTAGFKARIPISISFSTEQRHAQWQKWLAILDHRKKKKAPTRTSEPPWTPDAERQTGYHPKPPCIVFRQEVTGQLRMSKLWLESLSSPEYTLWFNLFSMISQFSRFSCANIALKLEVPASAAIWMISGMISYALWTVTMAQTLMKIWEDRSKVGCDHISRGRKVLA
jgi:hypothetical protein